MSKIMQMLMKEIKGLKTEWQPVFVEWKPQRTNVSFLPEMIRRLNSVPIKT